MKYYINISPILMRMNIKIFVVVFKYPKTFIYFSRISIYKLKTVKYFKII